ncbi:uncharacterized mitochondrial protein AtMg00860-like [Scyliorhinus canicula]|uniref:uncharacterized mitochondrial protein AtMg00860-like n=1 Tax=Scyliorhinus canicula TaxID=7830 RepID=UPI0018F62520|nr:uncharacterized mitochondrial protein AtMg00860-like [Scyliorhinus canicula]
MSNLEEVLHQFSEMGIHLKRGKHIFYAKEVTHLVYRMDRDGLLMDEEKVPAIKQAPTLENTTELRWFLSFVNYYGKFIPGLTAILAPLLTMLKMQQEWAWRGSPEEAFARVKQ